MSSSNKKNTLISIGLGVGALVFAFFMVLGDPQQGPQMMAQGGQIIKQIQDSTASIGKPQAETALAPESRLDMTISNPGSGGMGDMSVRSSAGDNSKSSVDSYLDGAWGTPQASQQAQMMPQQNFNNMPQQRNFGRQSFGRQGFGQFQRGMPQGGMQRGQGMGDIRKLMQEMNGGGGSPQDSSRIASSRGAVEYELNFARSQASQARACMSRAQSAQDRSEKEYAANEARSHANQAQSAASRAASRAAGASELQGLVGQARNFASQAYNSANDAASAASGW